MESIVIELENDILNNRLDIVSLLRKAHLIASKLGLTVFDGWINCELNGYAPKDKVPDYRNMHGRIVAKNPYYGWQSVLFEDEKVFGKICEQPFRNPISEIVDLTNSKAILIQLPPKLQALLNKCCDSPSDHEFAVEFSKSSVKDIEQQVKNNLLECCLKLEHSGIFGEGLAFTKEEKEIAAHKGELRNLSFNIFASENSQVTIACNNGDDSEISISKGEVVETVEQIKKMIQKEVKDQKDKDHAIELLSKIERNTKKSVIKSLLSTLKEFLVSVGAGVVAAFIEAKINGIA